MSPLSVHRARLADVEGIVALVAAHTADGALLPRTAESVRARLRDFVVAESAGQVIGCAALERLAPELAEVRSVVVRETHRGCGIGSQLVAAVLRAARRDGIPKVFCLTRRVSFFAGLGFIPVDKERFPQKVWRDCLHCPRRASCDEVAMERLLVPAARPSVRRTPAPSRLPIVA